MSPKEILNIYQKRKEKNWEKKSLYQPICYTIKILNEESFQSEG